MQKVYAKNSIASIMGICHSTEIATLHTLALRNIEYRQQIYVLAL